MKAVVYSFLSSPAVGCRADMLARFPPVRMVNQPFETGGSVEPAGDETEADGIGDAIVEAEGAVGEEVAPERADEGVPFAFPWLWFWPMAVIMATMKSVKVTICCARFSGVMGCMVSPSSFR